MTRHLLSVFALLLAASACRAADWPRWRGPGDTGRVPAGVAVPAALPAQPKVVWSIPVGAGNSSPVVSAGKVFCQDNQQDKETIHAFAAATGKELWQVPFDDVYRDVQSTPGPRCTPTVDGDRIYVQSSRGELQCLAVADGKALWRTSFIKDFGAPVPAETGENPGVRRHGNSGSPTIDGGHVLVNVGGPDGASVVCFDKLTGKLIWKSQNDVPGHAGPVIASLGGVRTAVCFTAEALIGLDAGTGALLWRVPIKTALGRHAVTPVVVGDTVVVGSYTAGLIGVRVTRQIEGFTAERAWTIPTLGTNYASAVAIGNCLYGLGPANTLFAVDIPTGEKTWAEPRFFGDSITTEYAGFIAMKNDLLVLTDTGALELVSASPKGCKQLAKVPVCGNNWCNPAYSDGKLYLRDGKELKCLQLLP